MKRLITRSDALPQHMQDELASMGAALDKKYGPTAHMVGTMLENLAQVCAMVRANNMTDEQRVQAWERSKDVCNEVIRTFGRLFNLEPEHVVAVANAYRDFSHRVEEELLGAEILDETKGEAAAAIAKAKLH